MQSEFYDQSVKRMIKEKGNRSSPEAVKEIREYAEDKAEELILEAQDLASHAQRKTIRKKDVATAIRQMND